MNKKITIIWFTFLTTVSCELMDHKGMLTVTVIEDNLKDGAYTSLVVEDLYGNQYDGSRQYLEQGHYYITIYVFEADGTLVYTNKDHIYHSQEKTTRVYTVSDYVKKEKYTENYIVTRS